MRPLFENFRHHLNYFFDHIPNDKMKQVFDAALSCRGTIFLTGVGKSGFIAQKIAATLVSTGTRALFLSPSDALHGDIGIVSSNDLFLILSKSGESEELLALLPFIRKKGAALIGVVANPSSRLAKLSDLFVHLPLQKEICPYDLAPTVSTAAQLIFGDCLAIALMQKKSFTIADFASNHPGGFLGKKITLKVSDLMLKGDAVPLCKSEDRLIDILPELTGKRCGCILVTDKEKALQGIFTDGDLRRAILGKGNEALQTPMGDLMTHSPKTAEAKEFAVDALRKMEEDESRPITVLPILEKGIVFGLLRMHDIIQSGLR